MIIHIGLGKTGTTSLQKEVFPRLVDEGVLEQYNPSHLMEALKRYAVTGEGESTLKSELAKLPEKTLISLESLAGWNPAFWRANASKNALIFPRSSTILITLRDAESYLTSVYIQMLHQGNIIKPEAFLLSEEDYKVIAPLTRPYLCEIFSVDDLDYAELADLYSDRFDEVIVVPVARLAELGFLKYLFSLPEVSLNNLRASFSKSKRENVSYSRQAIRLTFVREELLSRLGLRSKGSHDRFFEKYLDRFSLSTPCDRSMSLLSRVLIGVRSRLSWRYLMQEVVDRFLTYRKYQLPMSIPKGSRLDDNRDFYKRLLDLDCGYLLLKSESVVSAQRKPVTDTIR